MLAHHTIEDGVCFPALVARVPAAAALVQRTGDDHHLLDELMASCTVAVDGLEDGSSTPAVLAGRLGLLAAHMDAHLDVEDAEVLPLFEEHFTYAEYRAMDDEARKHLGLDAQAAFTIPFLVGFMPPDERAQVFGEAPLPLKVLYRATRGRQARLAARALGPGPRRRRRDGPVSLATFARDVVRRRRLVVAGWVVALVAGSGAGRGAAVEREPAAVP